MKIKDMQVGDVVRSLKNPKATLLCTKKCPVNDMDIDWINYVMKIESEKGEIGTIHYSDVSWDSDVELISTNTKNN